MNLLVKYPSRERPDQFMARLTTMVKLADNAKDLFFLFSFDANDPSMYPIAKLLEGAGLDGEIHFGESLSKIHAVNRDMEKIKHKWDIVLLMSDDMVCEKQGWDTIVKNEMAKHFPDTDGCLWSFDGGQKDICTMPIMGRKYYDRKGWIYNPMYLSVFADDEQTHKASSVFCLRKIEPVLFRHDHPAWNNAHPHHKVNDPLYKRNETTEIWDKDHATYKARKAAGFP